MQDKTFDQFEEDSILLNYDENFQFSSKRIREITLDNIFSFGNPLDISLMFTDDRDFANMMDSITKNLELLKLYIAANFSTITDEGIRRGIPYDVASQMKRNGLLALNKAQTEEEINACSLEFSRKFHKKYKELCTGAYSGYVKQAMDTIYFYKRKPVSAAKIAEILNVNESYLSKIFHKETGKTISEYILMVKMEQAVSLLESGAYQMSEISEQLGFSSPSYFSQRFKKYFGVSPEMWIKGKNNNN